MSRQISETAWWQIFIKYLMQTNQYFNNLILKHSHQNLTVQYYNANYSDPPPPPAFIFSSGGGFLWKLIKPGSPLQPVIPGRPTSCFFCSSSQKSEKRYPWGIYVLSSLIRLSLNLIFFLPQNPHHSSPTFTGKPTNDSQKPLDMCLQNNIIQNKS